MRRIYPSLIICLVFLSIGCGQGEKKKVPEKTPPKAAAGPQEPQPAEASVPTTPDIAEEFRDKPFVRVFAKDRRGYVNLEDGKWLTLEAPYEFSDVMPFSEELAAAQLKKPDDKNAGLQGWINKRGQIVIPPKYWNVGRFSEGRVAAELTEGPNKGKKGYLNKKAEWVIAPRFKEAREFSQGRAIVKLTDKPGYRFIDQQGKLINEDFYERVHPFKEGVALVRKGINKEGGRLAFLYGYVAQDGSWAIEPKFGGAGEFGEGLAAARMGHIKANGNKWGYIDAKGEWVIEPRFSFAGRFSDGLAPVMEGGKWGFIDAKGSFIIEPQYDRVSSFSEGLAPVRTGKDSSFSYINVKGKVVIEGAFKSAYEFKNGIARVRLEGNKDAYINTEGRILWQAP